MKMSHKNVGMAIDLSGLGLDRIREDGENFRIGAMVTLRELELHQGLDRYTEGALGAALGTSWASSSGTWPRRGAASLAGSGFPMC